MADTYYVMSCMTTIPPITNKLNHICLSKYLYGKFDSTEYQGQINHDAFVKNFSSFNANSYGLIEFPAIMDERKKSMYAASYKEKRNKRKINPQLRRLFARFKMRNIDHLNSRNM